MEDLGTIVLAIGALGTASFGIVEALKWTPIGLFGFNQITKFLGEPIMDALKLTYGPQFLSLMKAQYRKDRMSGELPRTIRQGVRVGLTTNTADKLARQVAVVTSAELLGVCKGLVNPNGPTKAQRGVLGRYELALDARIDAALSLANDRYIGWMRILSSFIAIIIALIVGYIQEIPVPIVLIVGVTAVPVAPISKDLSGAIRSAASAMSRGKP